MTPEEWERLYELWEKARTVLGPDSNRDSFYEGWFAARDFYCLGAAPRFDKLELGSNDEPVIVRKD